eukprot:10041391-Alexandrium_andersonii.AAC.1
MEVEGGPAWACFRPPGSPFARGLKAAPHAQQRMQISRFSTLRAVSRARGSALCSVARCRSSASTRF